MLARGGADRRNVLDLHGQAAGAFHQDRSGLVVEHFCDAAADQRVVIDGPDSEALENGVAIFAGRPVGAVGDQQLVAGRECRGQSGGHCGEARRIKRGPGGAGLELRQPLRKRPVGRGALESVAVLAELRLAAFQLGDAVEQYGRGALDRWADEASAPFLSAPALDELGRWALLALRHWFAPAKARLRPCPSPKTN